MTDQELKDIVAAVVAELEKSGVDFDYKIETPLDTDNVFVIRGTAPNYQGVTVTWKGLLDIITAQATQAKNDAETAKNAANAILTQVQSKGTEITNFVATSKTELETQKNESVNAVKSVYQTDLNELKGDLSDNAKSDAETKRSLNALWKLNQGISYQFEQDNTESYQKTVPSGAKLASIEQIGGNTEVIDSQLVSADVTEVTEQGKNLFDLTAFVQSMPTFYAISDGGLIIIKSYNSMDMPIFLTLPMGDYFVSVTNTTRIQVIANMNVLKDIYRTTGLSFTLTEESQVFFKFLSPNYEQYPYPHNVGLVQIEKGSAKTDYAPYRCNRYPIPDAVRNLTGYGWSAGEAYNAIERTDDGWQYVQRVGSRAYQEGDIVTDGVTTYYALDTPVITDITDLMADFPAYFEVEASGTITMENAAMLPVPSIEKYIIALQEVNG